MGRRTAHLDLRSVLASSRTPGFSSLLRGVVQVGIDADAMSSVGAPSPGPARHRGPTHIGIAVIDGVLLVEGEIDNAVLRAWTARHPGPPLVHTVDASGVTFLGSAGAALILRAVRACAPTRLVLRDPSRAALRPLQLMGLAELFDVVTPSDDAPTERGEHSRDRGRSPSGSSRSGTT